MASIEDAGDTGRQGALTTTFLEDQRDHVAEVLRLSLAVCRWSVRSKRIAKRLARPRQTHCRGKAKGRQTPGKIRRSTHGDGRGVRGARWNVPSITSESVRVLEPKSILELVVAVRTRNPLVGSVCVAARSRPTGDWVVEAMTRKYPRRGSDPDARR